MTKRIENISEDELRYLYEIRQWSLNQIAEHFGCSFGTIHNRMKEYGIPRRGRVEAGLIAKGIHIPEDELRELYEVRKLFPKEIAHYYGCNETTVYDRIRRYGLRPRTRSEAKELYYGYDITEEVLRDLYECQGLSIGKIAAVYDCDISTIMNKMKKFGIESRSAPEAHTIYPKSDFSGDPTEKAYLIGFRLGDLYVGKLTPGGETIWVQCGSTRPEQLELFERLFSHYGHVKIGTPREDGNIGISCGLNMSFAFLLPKEDRIEDWIVSNKEYFAAFLAGYVDAEGYIGISQGQAAFELRSFDKNILHQIHSKLKSLGIEYPKPRIARKKGATFKDHRPLKQDLWCIASSKKKILLALFDLIDPYLKHAKRRADMEAARANIEERNHRFGFLRMT